MIFRLRVDAGEQHRTFNLCRLKERKMYAQMLIPLKPQTVKWKKNGANSNRCKGSQNTLMTYIHFL